MKNLKKQKGFLSIVAVLIVVVVAVITVAASYQFTNDARTSADSLNSAQAYYLAQAGIEAGKHTIGTNGNSCTSINGAANYTNATFSGANGVFTVTGAPTSTASTLNGALSASATTIPLVSSSSFASNGTITIGSEYINYTGKSGNSLTGVTRGVAGSTAAAYGTGLSVIQYQCVLTSTGYVPSSASPIGKRILQGIIGGIKTFTIGSYTAPMYGVGNITIQGNSSINNSSVTSSSSNYPGSNIVSAGNVVLKGSAITTISDGSGGNTPSSDKNTTNPDVQENSTAFSTSNLFTTIFNGQSKATVKSNANTSYNNASSLNGATFASAGNKVIWVNSPLSISNTITIGSTTSPVMVVVNGDVNVTGGVTIYGLLYVSGNFTMNGNVVINGIAAIEGATSKTTGTSSINYDTSVLANLLTQSNSMTPTYKYILPITSLQEVLP